MKPMEKGMSSYSLKLSFRIDICPSGTEKYYFRKMLQHRNCQYVNDCAAYRTENTSISEHIQCIMMSMCRRQRNPILTVEYQGKCLRLDIHLLQEFQYKIFSFQEGRKYDDESVPMCPMSEGICA